MTEMDFGLCPMLTIYMYIALFYSTIVSYGWSKQIF